MAAGSLGVIWASVALDVAPLGAGAARARRMMYALDATMTSTASSMTAGQAYATATVAAAFTKMAKTIGLAALIISGVSVKMAADFDSSMRKVWSLTEASEATFREWSDQVIQFSKTVPTSAKDAGDALYWIKSAMPDSTDAQMFDTLNWAVKGAVGGVGDLTDTAKALTGAMMAYGDLRPEHYIDVLTKSVERGIFTMGDLAENLGKVTGMAAMAHVPIEQVAAAASVLTRHGVDVNTAFMAMNQLMMKIVKPSKAADELAKQYGIDLSFASLQAKGLGPLLMQVADAIQGDGDALADLFPNVRALKAALPLAGIAVEEFGKEIQIMGDATGTTNRMFQRNMQSMENRLKVMINRIRAPLIELGYKVFPYVEKAVSAVADAFEGKNTVVNSLVSTFKDLAAAAWAITAPLLRAKWLVLGLVGAFVGMKVINAAVLLTAAFQGVLSKLSIPLGALMFSAPKLAAALGTLLSPMTAVIALIGGKYIYDIYTANRRADELANTSIRLANSMAKQAYGARSSINEVARLQLELAKLTPDTEEYLRKQNELLNAQSKLVGSYPAVLGQMQLEGTTLSSNIKDLAEYIYLKSKAAAPGAAKGVAEFVANYEKQRTALKKLTPDINAYYGTVSVITDKLQEWGMETERANLIGEAFGKSFATGKKELEHWIQAERDAVFGTGELTEFLRHYNTASAMGNRMTREMGDNYNWLKDNLKSLSDAETKWKDSGIKNIADASKKWFEYYKNYQTMINDMKIAALEAGKAKGPVPTEVSAGMTAKDPYLKQQALMAGQMYIQEYFRAAGAAATAQSPEFASNLARLLQGAQFDAAWQQAGQFGGQELVRTWVASLMQQQATIAIETNKLPAIMVAGLRSATPEIRTATAEQTWAVIAAWTEMIPRFSGLGSTVANQLADGLAKGQIVETADEQANKAMVVMADRLGMTDLLSPALQKLADTMRESGELESAGGDAGKKAAEQAARAIDSDDSIVTAIHNKVKSAQAGMPTLTAKITPSVTPSEVTLHIKVTGSGTFDSIDDYAAYAHKVLDGWLSGPYTMQVGMMGGGGESTAIEDNLNSLAAALENARNMFGAAAPDSWLWRVDNEEILQLNQSIMSLTGNSQDAVNAWSAVTAEYNAAKMQVDALKETIDGLNEKMQDSQEVMNGLQWQLQESQYRMQKWQDVLTKYQGMHLPGEERTEAKSFATQQKINKLRLDIMKAEDVFDYERAAALQNQLDLLSRQKEEADLAAQVKYDPQRRQIEQALDAYHGQSAALDVIVSKIKKARSHIDAETRRQRQLNDQIWKQQQLQHGLQVQLDAAQRQYNRANDTLTQLEQKMQEVANNTTRAASEAKRFADEVARAAKEGAAPPVWNPMGWYQFGGEVTETGPAFVHKGEFILSRAMLASPENYLPVEALPVRVPALYIQQDITVNIPVELDGRVIAKSTAQIQGQNASAQSRSGGRY